MSEKYSIYMGVFCCLTLSVHIRYYDIKFYLDHQAQSIIENRDNTGNFQFSEQQLFLQFRFQAKYLLYLYLYCWLETTQLTTVEKCVVYGLLRISF